MLYDQLSRIKTQLSSKELSVSDGLLLTMRALRGHLPDAKLIWLNRELLGYRPEDLEEFSEKEPKKAVFPKIVMLWSPAKKQEEEKLSSPVYRFLQGTWGKLDESGGMTTICEPQLMEKSIFCNIGIQQLEAQLTEMDDPLSALFSMSFDKATGAEFYCYSKELVRIQEAVRIKLCQFLDEVMEDIVE
ncbi:MAG TPA: hypothetical protein PLC15_03065 [Candidatus Obscuribacter sp.]|nr:hypothetical protein [Candidatus Obscuribacter sp.]HMW88407.1 hypothetical protein [Candidatus Obscuribacter sp.]HMY51535.1 hypothetical protein [Candidatus Obscuribacter sp.]HNB14329.1 hypothetical protein [Candidatus Obscuribacter sp.]HND05352.1 hypothetical protein [Candidatus Obscuribacter sp.]